MRLCARYCEGYEEAKSQPARVDKLNFQNVRGRISLRLRSSILTPVFTDKETEGGLARGHTLNLGLPAPGKLFLSYCLHVLKVDLSLSL